MFQKKIVGKVAEFKKPTSTEGDDWKGKKTLSLNKAIQLGDKMHKKKHKNAKHYKMMQNIILKTIKHLI